MKTKTLKQRIEAGQPIAGMRGYVKMSREDIYIPVTVVGLTTGDNCEQLRISVKPQGRIIADDMRITVCQFYESAAVVRKQIKDAEQISAARSHRQEMRGSFASDRRRQFIKFYREQLSEKHRKQMDEEMSDQGAQIDKLHTLTSHRVYAFSTMAVAMHYGVDPNQIR